jgi:hypothetical protein
MKKFYPYYAQFVSAFPGLDTLLAFFVVLSIAITCMPEKDMRSSERVMPGGSMPEKLYVLDISDISDYHEQAMLYSYQGLINRKNTRIYYIDKAHDRFWLEYYNTTFGIDYEVISGSKELYKRFASEIDGYILYNPDNPHSQNLATTIGSIENLLPVIPQRESLMKELGLVKMNSAFNVTEDRIALYKNAKDKYLKACNQKLLAALCVHHPYWPVSTVKNRDYIMAHNIFAFDLSSSERDKSDYNLTKDIYTSVPEGAVVMGWHCVRDKEHEAIALSSEFGHYGMCNLHTSNLTVHSSIRLTDGFEFTQRKLKKDELSVEDKVYVAFMATDGDASWFMADLVETDWADPAHGQFKYNWGFLPLAYDLMPGTVKYYMENATDNDYFVAGPAGATYTYPHLHPDPVPFLEMSNEYMRKCGLTTVHMTNWNDRDWWQEVDIPSFNELLNSHLPDAMGFVRGMGESPFEDHYLGEGKPYIFCGEGIHKGSDVYQTMKDFIDACPNRPLFIYNLVNHSIRMSEIQREMNRFSKEEVEVVHLDELLCLADKAFVEGKISSDLFPDKTGLYSIIAKEANAAWPAFFDELKKLNDDIKEGEKAYMEMVSKTPVGVEPITPGDFLAFTTIWNSMKLIKLALEGQGTYVNFKPAAAEMFLLTFKNVDDAQVVMELHELWSNWHDIDISFEEAQILTRRLYNVAKQVAPHMEELQNL